MNAPKLLHISMSLERIEFVSRFAWRCQQGKCTDSATHLSECADKCALLVMLSYLIGPVRHIFASHDSLTNTITY